MNQTVNAQALAARRMCEPVSTLRSGEIQKLLNERDVAEITSLSLSSVRRFRLFQTGPRFLKLGAAVRYKPEDLFAWLDNCPSGGAPKGTGRRGEQECGEE